MMEQNRNLSSVIGTIQDEGPSATATGSPFTRAASGPEAVPDTGSVPDSGAGASLLQGVLSSGRPFAKVFIAALIVTVVTLIVFNGDEEAVSPVTAEPPGGEATLQQVMERQTQVLGRLDALSVAIRDMSAINSQRWAANEIELEALGEDLRENRENATLAIAALQRLLSQQQQPVLAISSTDEVDAPVFPEASTEPSLAADTVVSSTPTGQESPVPTNQPATIGAEEWVVNIAYSEQLGAMNDLLVKFKQAGITVVIQKVTLDGKTGYRARIPGFSSRKAAREYAANLDAGLGVTGPWASLR